MVQKNKSGRIVLREKSNGKRFKNLRVVVDYMRDDEDDPSVRSGLNTLSSIFIKYEKSNRCILELGAAGEGANIIIDFLLAKTNESQPQNLEIDTENLTKAISNMEILGNL